MDSDTTPNEGIFRFTKMMRRKQIVGESYDLEENFKTISVSILSGVFAGNYVNSSLGEIANLISIAIVIFTLLFFMYFFDKMSKLNGLESDEVKFKIMQLLTEEDMKTNDIFDELNYPNDKYILIYSSSSPLVR